MSAGKKYPLGIGLKVAGELVEMMEPHCERVQVAGSIRRSKLQIGDVEILYIPKLEIRQSGLFQEDTTVSDLTYNFLERCLRMGILEKRKNKNGSEIWGCKNKLAVHRESGLPVDLFGTSKASWSNYLVCRTGPGELNIEIAKRAKERGWKWNPYGSGFSKIDSMGCPHEHIVNSEQDVFAFVGLPWMEPEDRSGWKDLQGRGQ